MSPEPEGQLPDFDAQDCWRTIGVWGDVRPRCALLTELIHCHNCHIFVSAGRGLLDRPAPPGYLLEWATALARPKEVEAGERLSLLVFRIGDEWLAIATAACREVSTLHPIRRVPHRVDAVLRGLINVRGELLLCVSLAALLALEGAAGPPVEPTDASVDKVHRRTLVVEHRQRRWAFEVDEVHGVVRVRTDEVSPAPATVARDKAAHTGGLVKMDDKTLAVIDHERLFATLAKRVG